ncbi:MAG: 4Fe-4S binding protein [Spirochaetaceae bacterium]|nr:4Fe-4S binding protein [Spirochaetaceae bacterium]
MKLPKPRRLLFRIIRFGILAAVLAFVSWEFYAHARVNKIHPSVHALCPLGGLESLLAFISGDGTTLAKIFSGTMGLFFVSMGVALLFKRSFCGAVCPLGALQDIAGGLGRAILGPKRFLVPAAVDRVLRFAKYAVLVLAIVMAWVTGGLWIQTFDPWPAYSHLFNPAELLPTYGIGLVILIVSLAASFFYERAFCKYLCPMGAALALPGLASPFKVRRDALACIDCGLCDKACPANIKVSKASAIVDPECLSCSECAAVCPAPKALDTGFSARFRLPPAAAVAFGAGAFFLGLFVLQLFGFDRFSGRQEPTLRELARSAGMTTADLKRRYGLGATFFAGTRSSAVEKAIPLSKMAELNGTDTASIKAELGLDPDLNDETTWGEAYGSVSLGKIAEMGGVTVEEIKERFFLKASVDADTPWRDVERDVLRAAERLEAGAGEGGHGAE